MRSPVRPILIISNSTIQNGQATIAATFTLNSNKTTDLVEVQRRVASAEGNLPGDLVTPTTATFDPGEPTVATLVVTSYTLSPTDLSLLVNNQNSSPYLEQAPGIANVNAGCASTPAIRALRGPGAPERVGRDARRRRLGDHEQ